MANDIELITITGHVQPRDAEARFSSSGTEVLSFIFVSGRSKKNADTGEWDSESDWFRVTAFGNVAKRIADKASKGTRMLISGRFSTREYVTASGEKRVSNEITANEIAILPAEVYAKKDAPSESVPF